MRWWSTGPSPGTPKAAYLAGLDVFLFPSRYRNESFGIVVAEAMAAGVPVIAHEAGCLDAGWVGPGGVVLDLETDFVPIAADQIGAWIADPDAHRAAVLGASRRGREGWATGCRRAGELADAIAGPPGS